MLFNVREHCNICGLYDSCVGVKEASVCSSFELSDEHKDSYTEFTTLMSIYLDVGSKLSELKFDRLCGCTIEDCGANGSIKIIEDEISKYSIEIEEIEKQLSKYAYSLGKVVF